MTDIRILETPQEMEQVQELQRLVWPGSEVDIIPAHVLLTFAHNGGLVLGAYEGDTLVGLSVGFPGIYQVPDGPRLKHCSHELGVHPNHRDSGLGFALKRAQWQAVRQQGIDRITWTYDPLLSRNAHLNIARLGAVCNTYLRELYGIMRDGLNAGLPSDRFQVDWWVYSQRVERRLGSQPRPKMTLDQYRQAGCQFLYDAARSDAGWLAPTETFTRPQGNIVLAEIPSDFPALKAADLALARDWKLFARSVFETCFEAGFLVTDFVHESDMRQPRSFYVLTHGESQLQ